MFWDPTPNYWELLSADMKGRVVAGSGSWVWEVHLCHKSKLLTKVQNKMSDLDRPELGMFLVKAPSRFIISGLTQPKGPLLTDHLPKRYTFRNGPFYPCAKMGTRDNPF